MEAKNIPRYMEENRKSQKREAASYKQDWDGRILLLTIGLHYFGKNLKTFGKI
jgi:hypothetical protein